MSELYKQVVEEATDEATKLLPQVYEDIAQPAAKEIGSILGRSTRALLSPVRGLLWGWEKIESAIIEGVERRLERIPEENRKTPDPEIAVPLMQAFTYTAQNETLREMYLNLLANSMDISQEKNVHPSFVEIIKQMNSLDAKLFQILSRNEGYIKAVNPNVSIVDQGKCFMRAVPEWFLGWTIEGYDIFQISASLIRLGRLGIVKLMFDRTAGKDGYEQLMQNPILIKILNSYKAANPTLNLAITGINSILYVNEFGKQFAKSCLPSK